MFLCTVVIINKQLNFLQDSHEIKFYFNLILFVPVENDLKWHYDQTKKTRELGFEKKVFNTGHNFF